MKSSPETKPRAFASQVAATFLLATAGAIAWNVYRRGRAARSDRLVDWDRVHQIASALTGADGTTIDRAERERKQAAFRLIIDRVTPRMLDYLGLGDCDGFPVTVSPLVLDRREWIEANIEGFMPMFHSVEGVVRDRFGRQLAQPLNQMASSALLAVLLAYLSRRVLGQYDPALFTNEPVVTGKLFFVEPNLEHTRRQLGLPREQFETWIVFHELTHWWQFESHPWLRDFMNGQIRRLITSAAGKLTQFDVSELLRVAMRGELDLKQPQTILTSVMTSDQRELFDRLQAIMCLLEGFSNHVMDALGPEMLPDYEEISQKFDRRQRAKSSAEKLFIRLTGLQVKMEQYVVGERFVDEVARARGIGFVNRAWEAPDALPTLREIYHPEQWISRVESCLVTPGSL